MAHPTDPIVGAMRSPTTEDRALITRAYNMAEKAHGDEKRKSGEPYITHPLAIAERLAEIGMDRDTIIAGMLHDTLEDTTLTSEEIEKEFGPTVRFLVEGVTKLAEMRYRGLDRAFESLKKLLLATAKDTRVIVIKLADRLHNMETLSFVAKEKQLRIAKETMNVYVPLAERLGIGLFKTPLEDLAFKVIDPKGYANTFAFLAKQRTDMEAALADALKEVKKELAEHGFTQFRTEMRVKGVHSFSVKLDEKKGHVEKVYDLFALRIIVPTIEDCYRVFGIIHAKWKPLPGRIKDYIATPKPNGYRSLHTAVITDRGLIIEIQIRTEDMHHDAQYGAAAHFSYKAHGSEVRADQRKTWADGILNIAKDESSEHAKAGLSNDLLAERMFVFTPKGEVVDLPVGSTPVDFAYAIHSGLGDGTTGARVNGKMVSLETELHNGDKVEIITRKNGKPNKKWLESVKTSGARKHIRSALKLDPR